MENKNVFIAIALSMSVLLFWSAFVDPPQNINKQNVSTICNVSEVTIGKCYKKMYDYKKILLPKSAIIKYNIE